MTRGGFTVSPDEIDHGAEAVGGFSTQLGTGGQRIGQSTDNLVEHASGDRSGIGSVLVSGLQKGGKIFGDFLREAGRVTEGCCGRLHSMADSHRGNENDIRGSFTNEHTPTADQPRPHQPMAMPGSNRPGGEGSAAGGHPVSDSHDRPTGQPEPGTGHEGDTGDQPGAQPGHGAGRTAPASTETSSATETPPPPPAPVRPPAPPAAPHGPGGSASTGPGLPPPPPGLAAGLGRGGGGGFRIQRQDPKGFNNNPGQVKVKPADLFKENPQKTDTPIDTDQVNKYAGPGYHNLQNPPKIMRLPDNDNLKMNTPLKDVPAGNKHGFGPEDDDKTIGQLMTGQHDPTDDRPARTEMQLSGGGGYQPKTGVIALGGKSDDKTLYHEMGHQKQQETQSWNSDNTDRMALEYHNILHNENANPDKPTADQGRIDYTLGAKEPHPYPETGQTWQSMRQNVNANPDEAWKANTNAALDQIDHKLGPEGDAFGNSNLSAQEQQRLKDTTRQNLVAQYFQGGRH